MGAHWVHHKYDGWSGRSSAPIQKWDEILPQEELSWESWGGGDAPLGMGAVGTRGLPIKVPCF